MIQNNHVDQWSSRCFELGVSGAKLFEAWREAHLAVFEVAGQTDQIETFDGKLKLWSTGRFVLNASACTGISFVRSPEPARGKLLDHFGIRLVQAGTAKGTVGTRKLLAAAGDLVFLDLQKSMRFETSIEGGVTSDLTLWIPRSRLQSLVAEEHLLHGVVLKDGVAGGAVLGAALRTFAMHADHVTVGEMDELADGLVGLAAKILASPLQAIKQSQFATPLESFVTIRRFIDANLASRELGIDMIAKSFGLSRASLYRLFEPIGGVASYIRKQRLARALQEITATGFANRRIGPIAYRCGFKSVAVFNRAFRQTYGIKPTQARSAASAIFPRTAISPAIDGDVGVLARWLLEISR
jgi:AraC-like DNA-binding protein